MYRIQYQHDSDVDCPRLYFKPANVSQIGQSEWYQYQQGLASWSIHIFCGVLLSKFNNVYTPGSLIIVISGVSINKYFTPFK